MQFKNTLFVCLVNVYFNLYINLLQVLKLKERPYFLAKEQKVKEDDDSFEKKCCFCNCQLREVFPLCHSY